MLQTNSLLIKPKSERKTDIKIKFGGYQLLPFKENEAKINKKNVQINILTCFCVCQRRMVTFQLPLRQLIITLLTPSIYKDVVS